ncbi:MAG: hypothetical protein ACRD43_09875 [Pyrinomonadaceae bacterium]
MAIETQKIVNKVVTTIIFSFALFGFGCGGSTSGVGTNDSPTEAYKRLFAAVKSKDINAIKNEMSKQSNTLVASIAAMQKKSVDDVYANGLTSSLHSDTLPEMRDERVNNEMGALEVYNSGTHKWEDIPFILEDGRWKLAVGDALKGTYKSPGKGRDQKEKEAANALSNMNNGGNKTGPAVSSNSAASVENNQPATKPPPPSNAK